MIATTTNLTVDQGCSFEYAFYLQDNAGNARSLSSYTAQCQMRKDYDSPSYSSITCTIPYPTSGIINLSMNPEETYVLAAGRYFYDVFITSSDGPVNRVATGQVTVFPSTIR